MKSLLLTFISVAFLSIAAVAQTGVKGTVTDTYGEPLIGATVVDQSTTQGGITGLNGNFEIETPAGSREIVVSFVGYNAKTFTIEVKNGQMTDMGRIELKGSTIGLGSIDIVADRARERETPVAFSNISRTDLKEQLGSRDIPMVMNITPSVYATQQGGGAGDARINVRGFNQRNVAIMINGVPVNDMENGWVYWSNWDGVADATSSIQMQRGLSAVNLATPSIGGTMNIITSPTDHHAGGSARFEYGSGNFIKSTLTGHSGLINDKFALSASIVRKVGDGVIDATWTDAWAYYFGASYILSKNHRLEFYALGAPQRHGQNLYKQNVAVYDHEYAKELGVVDGTLEAFPEADAGRYYNQNWNNIKVDYNGKQYWNGSEHDRYDEDFINERENFYHKPLTNLNLYSQWNDKLSQFTTVYYSGGKGGGTGTYGDVEWDYSTPSRRVDWDETYRTNTQNDTAYGILRNSVNNQWTIGAISKVKVDFTDNLRASVGVDWRTAEIQHYREVRDLLGGQFFHYTGNAFDSGNDYNKTLGDKIAYDFTNTVDWVGYFAQLEYSNEMITAYGTFGHSFIKYSYVNHFAKEEGTDNELTAETDFLDGLQLKGGLSYRPADGFSIYGNFGYISKAPIFDNIINDRSGVVAEDPQNEVFTAFEGGVTYETPDRNFEVKANYYYTQWTDRALNLGIVNQDGTEGFIFVQGMDQLHSGFEVEVTYNPVRYIALAGMASVGSWEYLNNVSGSYKNYEDPTSTEETYNYYVEGLKVGDAPQTQFAAILKVMPVKDMMLQVDWRHYSNHYADWDPFSRSDESDAKQVWKTPEYMLFDLHASYRFTIANKYNLEVFGHVFNLLDEIYIQDATDNSSYNGYYGENDEYSHTVNSAEIFLGLPRTYNVGLEFTF